MLERLIRDDLAQYIADHYGSCRLGTDCYWGKDAAGNWNGCSRIGWKGTACQYWIPTTATNWDELYITQLEVNRKD